MMPDTRLRLTKHHGAGNDFLVLADAAGRPPVSVAAWGWAPTGCCGRCPVPVAPTSPWSCAMPTAVRPR